jgi:hypothetical protein
VSGLMLGVLFVGMGNDFNVLPDARAQTNRWQ